MMGGGLCWLDYDNDGWMDLFAVNSYTDANAAEWLKRGGFPRSALYRNAKGRFVDVSRASHANLAVRGNGCVAADFNGDGFTDLYVSTAVDDKLLWNDGDGTFTQGARPAGVVSFGWHTGAAVADVNGDGRPDLFVAGYTNPNAPIPELRLRLPDEPRGRARPALPQPGERPERACAVPRGRHPGRARAFALRARPRRSLHAT